MCSSIIDSESKYTNKQPIHMDELGNCSDICVRYIEFRFIFEHYV